MNATLRVMNLTKKFGKILAVDNISFSATQGEVVGLLGPNGAGKSTTMKMITGFITPTAGTAYVGGYDITEQPVDAKKIFGYLAEGAPSYPEMTVSDFINFIADIRNISKDIKNSKINIIINQLSLESVLNQRIDSLSKGFKQRLGLAQASIHDPQVLILDEPTDGLDLKQKHEIRKLITSIAADRVIIISTHILEEVEALCNRILVLSAGKLILDSTPQDLVDKSSVKNTVGALEELFINIGKECEHA